MTNINDFDDDFDAARVAETSTYYPESPAFCNAPSPSGKSSCYLDKGHTGKHYAPCGDHGDVCDKSEHWNDWNDDRSTDICINKTGYLVTHTYRDDTQPLGVSTRTYACTDREALDRLIIHLTGRSVDTYPKITGTNGLPSIAGISVAYPLHIYSRS